MTSFMLCMVVTATRWATGEAVHPLEVHLTRGAPRSTAGYLSTLGVLPRFDAERDAIFFSSAQLQTRLRTANPALVVELERHVNETLSTFAQGQSIIGRVRGLLAGYLEGPTLGATDLARELGTSYRGLLDEVRAEHARRLLDDGLSTAEVSARLGFAEPGAFHRAFRRWFGRPVSNPRDGGPDS